MTKGKFRHLFRVLQAYNVHLQNLDLFQIRGAIQEHQTRLVDPIEEEIRHLYSKVRLASLLSNRTVLADVVVSSSRFNTRSRKHTTRRGIFWRSQKLLPELDKLYDNSWRSMLTRRICTVVRKVFASKSCSTSNITYFMNSLNFNDVHCQAARIQLLPPVPSYPGAVQGQ